MRLFRLSAIFLIFLCACAIPPKDVKLQDFVSQNDLDVVSLTREGLNYYAKSRFVDAEFKFREALAIAADADNIRFNLAMSLIQQREYEESEAILLELVKYDTESTKILTALAHLYMSKRDFGQAIKYYDQAYEKALEWREFGPAASFARSLSILHFTLGHEPEALCYSDIAKNLIENNEEVCKHGRLLMAEGYSTEALKYVQKFLSDNEAKRDPCLTQEMAFIHFSLNSLSEAMKFSEIAMNLKAADAEDKKVSTLIQYVAEAENTAVNDKNEKKTEEESEDDGDVNPIKTFFTDGKGFYNTHTIYWPLNFLNYLEKNKPAEEEE